MPSPVASIYSAFLWGDEFRIPIALARRLFALSPVIQELTCVIEKKCEII